MKKRKRYLAGCLVIFCCFLHASGNAAHAQEPERVSQQTPVAARREEVNHDVQLFLLLASNDSAAKNNLPASMDGVVRQLKTTLPFSNYRLTMTLLQRVRDGGNVEMRGFGNLSVSPVAAGTGHQSFYQLRLERVKLNTEGAGAPFVHLARLNFSLKAPIVTATIRAEGSSAATPVVQYEDTGISTELSAREGEPTVVSTITTSRPDELYVLVLLVKRTAAR